MLSRTYSSWHGIWACLALLQFFPAAMPAVAADEPCPRAQAKGADGMLVEFAEHAFADGDVDLVMRLHTASGVDIKRVTYGEGKTEGCLNSAVSLAPGGGADQWGWHLAWGGERGVRYARMDGEAWVSSPPKRFSAGQADSVQLQVSGSEVRLRWREQHGDRSEVYQAVSQDEGRSWGLPERVQSTD